MAYTLIDDPSAYFQTALWTGDGSAGNAVTFDGNSDMQPDFVWSKRRDDAFSHVLKDTSRGGTSNNDLHLVSNLTNAESTYTNYRMDFNSDGFTLDGVGDSGFQGSGTSMVSWAWKANGGTTASNTDGTITSTVQANTDAGFSIITYTAPSSSGNFTAGHGLGVKPAMVITKSRSATGGWWTWHKDLAQPNYYIGLHSTVAQAFEANIWGAGFDTSTIGLNVAASAQASQTYVAYCFAEKQGYSKFGSYVGNGSADGPFIYTGFKPAFVMMKNYSVGASWHMVDNKRLDYNPTTKVLYANLSNAEGTEDRVDLLSNGFKLRTTNTEVNGNGYNIIYMAFAENPFTTSTGIPTTAR